MDVLTSSDPLWISEKVPSPVVFRAHPLFICQISCTAQWRNMHFGNAIFGSSNAHIARRARPLYNFQKHTFSNINHSRAECRIPGLPKNYLEITWKNSKKTLWTREFWVPLFVYGARRMSLVSHVIGLSPDSQPESPWSTNRLLGIPRKCCWKVRESFPKMLEKNSSGLGFFAYICHPEILNQFMYSRS